MTTLRRYPLSEVLVENSTYASRGVLVKRLVNELKWPYRCMITGCPNPDPQWNGKPLTLQLDHINGVRNDNRVENLRIICPNCHTQTETFCGKKSVPWDKKKLRSSSTISSDTVDRIQVLLPLAKYVRHQHSEDDPKVVASRELDRILKDLSSDGYTYKALAEVTGTSLHSVRNRVLNQQAREKRT